MFIVDYNKQIEDLLIRLRPYVNGRLITDVSFEYYNKLEILVKQLINENNTLRESKLSVSSAPSRWIDEIVEDLEKDK